MNAKIMTVEKVSKSFSMSLIIFIRGVRSFCNIVEMQTIEKFLASFSRKIFLLTIERRIGMVEKGGSEREKS
jgi:hypothetical protein